MLTWTVCGLHHPHFFWDGESSSRSATWPLEPPTGSLPTTRGCGNHLWAAPAPAVGLQGRKRLSRSEARPAARPGHAEAVSPAVCVPATARVPWLRPARRAVSPWGARSEVAAKGSF